MNLFKLRIVGRLAMLIFSCAIFLSNLQAQITWNATIDVAMSSFGNDHPRMVTNGSGNPMIIWSSSGNVMFSRWTGTAFSTPVQLNQGGVSVAGGGWMGPEIASHGDTVYVVFKQTPENSSNSNVWCTRSFDGGATFSAPVQVQNIGTDISRFPVVTTDVLGNPIVGFMRFNSLFGDPRWVVTTSSDFGNTFSADVLASGWSSPTSEVCDCCPGSMASSDSIVAMLYRDNNNNLRDCWVGISTDGGSTFSGGMDVDQQGWNINSCPSSASDGIIIGDTLYSTFMSAASGTSRVYFNRASISAMTGAAGTLLTGNISGLLQQNYPRISNAGNAVAIAWKQIVNGNSQLPILFSDDITNGQPFVMDTVKLDNITNTDIALTTGNVYVAWQDDNSGTVKFRSGTYSPVFSGIKKLVVDNLTVYPNPSEDGWTLNGNYNGTKLKIELFDIQGKLIQSTMINNYGNLNHKVEHSTLSEGTYFIRISNEKEQFSVKVVKQ